MYNSAGVGSLTAGAGGAAAAVPFLGLQAIWIGLATFTLVSACLALGRILPKRTGERADDIS
ncbi:hypothetical protein [Actinomadura rudentiformis]|uniref:Uncharacterized protein n=1 Tax=Actinomadura rudentiformis TaxID=359158 RepID=A0A6H9YWE2_9ACTN|nr:hypothetical protein [Actinomadura rudentiformis]KAB2345188.1 hypothetical protein F8566_28385 [Actinomadura rudentiformis]